MINWLILFLCAPNSHSATFEGYTGLRHVIQKIDDGLNTKNAQGKDSSQSTRKQYQIRAGLRAKGTIEPSNKVSWALGFRTTSSASSDWITWQNGSDRAIGLETVMFQYAASLSGSTALQIGRASTVFIHDGLTQALWDRDTRWDGIALRWEGEPFGLNFSHYILGARNSGVFGTSSFTKTEASEADANSQSGMGALSGAQAYLRWRLGEQWRGTLALARYYYSGAQGALASGAYQNAVHGGVAGTVGNVDPVLMDNARQWHLYSELNWRLWRVIAEYVQNKKVFYGTRTTPTNREAQRDALALSLVYGSTREIYDAQISYSYVRKGIGSVVGTFTHSTMPADNLGHLLDARMAVAKNLNIGAKAEFYEELAKKGGDGLPSTPSSRNQKLNNFEFYGGVVF